MEGKAQVPKHDKERPEPSLEGRRDSSNPANSKPRFNDNKQKKGRDFLCDLTPSEFSHPKGFGGWKHAFDEWNSSGDIGFDPISWGPLILCRLAAHLLWHPQSLSAAV